MTPAVPWHPYNSRTPQPFPGTGVSFVWCVVLVVALQHPHYRAILTQPFSSVTDTVAPGSTSAPAAADLAHVVTATPGTSPSPEATRVPTLRRQLPTQAPGGASTPGAPASPGTTLTPSTAHSPAETINPVAPLRTTGPTGITVVPADPTPSPAGEGHE